jgi:hypothetical protein
MAEIHVRLMQKCIILYRQKYTCEINLIIRYSIIRFLHMLRPDLSRHICIKTSLELLNASDIPKKKQSFITEMLNGTVESGKRSKDGN